MIITKCIHSAAVSFTLVSMKTGQSENWPLLERKVMEIGRYDNLTFCVYSGQEVYALIKA